MHKIDRFLPLGTNVSSSELTDQIMRNQEDWDTVGIVNNPSRKESNQERLTITQKIDFGQKLFVFYKAPSGEMVVQPCRNKDDDQWLVDIKKGGKEILFFVRPWDSGDHVNDYPTQEEIFEATFERHS